MSIKKRFDEIIFSEKKPASPTKSEECKCHTCHDTVHGKLCYASGLHSNRKDSCSHCTQKQEEHHDLFFRPLPPKQDQPAEWEEIKNKSL